MKTLITLSVPFLLACGGTQSVIIQNPATQTKTTEETKVSVADYQEELAYRASLDRIQDRFIREKRVLENLLKNNPKEYENKKNEYCEIELFIDLRGGHHIKPYC